MPILSVIAGPNGSGKSTLIAALRDQRVAFGKYFNADDIAKNLDGSAVEVARRAQEMVRIGRAEALANGESHSFETVMSHISHVEYMQKARANGYEVRLYFVATDRPEVNVLRVANRVAHGGHDVPEDRIVSRYFRSLGNLPNAIAASDVAMIFDNSQAAQPHRLLASILDRKLIHHRRLDEIDKPELVPAWWINILLRMKPVDTFQDGPLTTTRFAPSPTGTLHVGNVRTALHNWLLAKQAGGRFLLRIDDTDLERSREEYVDAIKADLAWLGLHWDGEERQSQRFDLYENEFQKLVAAGRVYRCYETAQELDLKRKVQLGRGLPPIYDRAALALSAADHAAKAAAREQPHWRFLLDRESQIEWTDGIRGPQHFDPAKMSDPVVRRADGSWLYLLPSVIDDIDMGITDVLRGEDHVSNTATQLQMFTALGAAPPRFAHEALLVGTEGKLSKRLGSLGMQALREAGIEPEALVALLARLGTSDPVDPTLNADALAATFTLTHFGRAPARFDEAELHRVNAALVHRLPYARVAHLLPEGMGEAAWEAIQPNLEHISEAADWWQVVTGPVAVPALEAEDRDYLAQAAEVLASADDWKALTNALKDSTGRKGKPLFMPLRLALTGMDHGPDMAALLPLIGHEAAIARLITASRGMV